MLTKYFLKEVSKRSIFSSNLIAIKYTSKSYSTIKLEEQIEKRPLYLDAQATTAIDPRVLDDMLPYMTNMYTK